MFPYFEVAVIQKRSKATLSRWVLWNTSEEREPRIGPIEWNFNILFFFYFTCCLWSPKLTPGKQGSWPGDGDFQSEWAWNYSSHCTRAKLWNMRCNFPHVVMMMMMMMQQQFFGVFRLVLVYCPNKIIIIFGPSALLIITILHYKPSEHANYTSDNFYDTVIHFFCCFFSLSDASLFLPSSSPVFIKFITLQRVSPLSVCRWKIETFIGAR